MDEAGAEASAAERTGAAEAVGAGERVGAAAPMYAAGKSCVARAKDGLAGRDGLWCPRAWLTEAVIPLSRRMGAGCLVGTTLGWVAR